MAYGCLGALGGLCCLHLVPGTDWMETPGEGGSSRLVDPSPRRTRFRFWFSWSFRGCGGDGLVVWGWVTPCSFDSSFFVAARLFRLIPGGVVGCGFRHEVVEGGNAWHWSRQARTIVSSDRVARAGWSFPLSGLAE